MFELAVKIVVLVILAFGGALQFVFAAQPGLKSFDQRQLVGIVGFFVMKVAASIAVLLYTHQFAYAIAIWILDGLMLAYLLKRSLKGGYIAPPSVEMSIVGAFMGVVVAILAFPLVGV